LDDGEVDFGVGIIEMGSIEMYCEDGKWTEVVQDGGQ